MKGEAGAAGARGASETLPQLIVERARQTPRQLAQRHKHHGIWKRFTWADVLSQVRDFGMGLAALGLQRGETVAIIGENEPEHFWAEYAAMAMGGKAVSLYPDVTAEEAAYILIDSEAVFLVAQDQEQVDKAFTLLDQVPGLRRIIYWDDRGMWSYDQPVLTTFKEVQELGRRHGEANPSLFDDTVSSGRSDDVCVLSYTSGTTGRPKGVVLTHKYLFDNASRVGSAVTIRPGSEYLSYIAPAWGTEQLFGIFMGVWVPMVVNFPEKPESVLTNLREIAVETLVFSPRQWESLASMVQARMFDVGPWRRRIYDWGLRVGHDVNVSRLEGKSPPALARLLYPLANIAVLKPLRDKLGLVRAKVAYSGGSAMAPQVFQLFHAMGVPLRNLYGATEVGILTVHRGSAYNLETVGHWLDIDPAYGEALQWRVTDEGELEVCGASGFGGYYRQPEKTAEKLTDGWFRTGDAVTMTESGEVVFLDRVSDMRRLSGGHTYPPQFIETRLRFSPFIKDLMTVGDATRPYVSALINIDFDVVGRWAEDRNIGFSTFTDLSQKPEITELVRGEIERVNQFLPDHAKVRRFANFPKELDPDEGELTRTRKLRREFLEERYRTIVEAVYRGDDAVDAEIPVTYQDGRRGVLRARVALIDVDQSASMSVSAPDHRSESADRRAAS